MLEYLEDGWDVVVTSAFILRLPLGESLGLLCHLDTNVLEVKSDISKGLNKLVCTKFFVNFNLLLDNIIVTLRDLTRKFLLKPCLTLG